MYDEDNNTIIKSAKIDNNDKPLVSVLMPVYNGEKFLATTIKNILAQSYNNIELIIVDDGSTDASYDIAIKHSNIDQRVKVFKQPNSGASAARNRALAESTGEYIMYMDADDLMTKNKIANQIVKLHSLNESHAVVFCGYEEFVHEIPSEVQNRFLYHDYTSPIGLLIDIWAKGAMIPLSCYLISKTMSSVVGNWDERLSMNDDGDYFSRVLMKATKVYFVENCCFFYRRGHISLSTANRFSEAKLTSLLFSYKKQKSILAIEDNLKVRNALARNFSIVLNSAKYGSKLYNEALSEIKYLKQKPQIINPSALIRFFVSLFGAELYLRIKSWIR